MKTYVTERSAHDNGFVVMLLVVVEDALYRLDTRVVVTFIVLTRALLVPVKNLNLRYQRIVLCGMM